ncbi:MAG: HAD family hydrolase [Candidatus Cloacimonetes bacterium]|nr:HAD family hydrolase [Candidatus Cloacimonadota bacterium]MCB5255128.1 HAD family hydrolase [Candidatus Cloacimonadota bacterium]MCK9177674.1 HAD family hydrolase [Candidatus Cloacimonadota bacterium]MCK9241770.1 HAD family hydrolase [Candidatus Cloacimonadota bacterium]MDD3102677.1 HAD family hydrolase [Candidatus Cloacimonadota bacterium]
MTVKSIRRAIFLDRDGTISPDEFGYIKDPDLYHLYPETPDALRIFKELGYLIFIVTNQSGIARGYLNLAQLDKVHEKMLRLISDAGIQLDGIYFSPYHIDGIVQPYNIDHEDRKPGIGMFKQASAEYSFDPCQSFMIGDRGTDIGFAQNSNMKSILLLSGNGKEEMGKLISSDAEYKPDFICENILTAAEMIKRFFS